MDQPPFCLECFSSSKRTKFLACTHVFCEDCLLRRYLRESYKLECIVCSGMTVFDLQFEIDYTKSRYGDSSPKYASEMQVGRGRGSIGIDGGGGGGGGAGVGGLATRKSKASTSISMAPMLSLAYNPGARILDRKASGLIGDLIDELGCNPMGLALFLPPAEKETLTSAQVAAGRGMNPKSAKRRKKGRALLFVADWDNHRIQVFNAIDSSVHKQISGGHGSGADQLIAPEGICLGLDPKDPLLYVCDTGNHRIQRYNAHSGRHVGAMASVGGKGAGVGQLHGPCGICVGSADPSDVVGGDRLLYVSEFHNNCVQVFDAATGLHVRMIGENLLRGPRGVCLGPILAGSEPIDQLLYVVDSIGGSVQVFSTRSGAHVRKIEGAGANRLKNPAGLCLGSSGIVAGDTADRLLYVCDCDNSRIQVFDIDTGECKRTIETGDVPFFVISALDPWGRPLLFASVAQACVRVLD